MFYTVYKITNKVNGKIYIGVHKTSDLSDGYMGSGKLIKAAIEKYGIENFDREYLKVFDNPEDMFNMESELVNEEFVSRDDTYNIKIGGEGGWTHINSNEEFRINKNKKAGHMTHKLHAAKQFTWGKMGGIRANELHGLSENFILAGKSAFLGKHHTEETKRTLRNKAKLRTGDKSSGFGSMWIMNSETSESKKIKKTDDIPDGWVKGRRIK